MVEVSREDRTAAIDALLLERTPHVQQYEETNTLHDDAGEYLLDVSHVATALAEQREALNKQHLRELLDAEQRGWERCDQARQRQRQAPPPLTEEQRKKALAEGTEYLRGSIIMCGLPHLRRRVLELLDILEEDRSATQCGELAELQELHAWLNKFVGTWTRTKGGQARDLTALERVRQLIEDLDCTPSLQDWENEVDAEAEARAEETSDA